MALDDLSFLPHTSEDMNGFAFSNLASHRDINRAILQQQTLSVSINSLVYVSATGALSLNLSSVAIIYPGPGDGGSIIGSVGLLIVSGNSFIISGITGGTGGGTYTGLNGTWVATGVNGNVVSAVVTSGLGTITTVTGTPSVTGVGTLIPEYAIYPLDIENTLQWGWQHQQMHAQAWRALGGSGYDLSKVNWQDEEYMREWTALHSDEHNRLTLLLGL